MSERNIRTLWRPPTPFVWNLIECSCLSALFWPGFTRVKVLELHRFVILSHVWSFSEVLIVEAVGCKGRGMSVTETAVKEEKKGWEKTGPPTWRDDHNVKRWPDRNHYHVSSRSWPLLVSCIKWIIKKLYSCCVNSVMRLQINYQVQLLIMHWRTGWGPVFLFSVFKCLERNMKEWEGRSDSNNTLQLYASSRMTREVSSNDLSLGQ